jgi:hypothetical protein
MSREFSHHDYPYTSETVTPLSLVAEAHLLSRLVAQQRLRMRQLREELIAAYEQSIEFRFERHRARLQFDGGASCFGGQHGCRSVAFAYISSDQGNKDTRDGPVGN